MFYTSKVSPYIEVDKNTRCLMWVMCAVKWYKDDKFESIDDSVCLGSIHDDEYIDVDKILGDIEGKPLWKATKIMDNKSEYCY